MLRDSLAGAFKAYDIRGRVPDELDQESVWAIARAYARVFGPGCVALGHDIRPSSESLAAAVADGLRTEGVDVMDIGLCGTEEMYFATFHLNLDGGIMVTASHNPKNYNGLKLVREQARPISEDTGLKRIAVATWEQVTTGGRTPGRYRQVSIRDAYVKHLTGCIDRNRIAGANLLVNAGNGCAGPAFDALAAELQLTVTRMNHEPDGRFPNGVPNPLLTENRLETSRQVIANDAQLGIAWDGDFDRCFVFDEKGEFIDGYYLIGLLAASFLEANPGQCIVHDPRLIWNTVDVVNGHDGTTALSRCGHTFMKETMRTRDAIYGGEMSGHHYFRDFGYCDSGMLPWLRLLEVMATANLPLSRLVEARKARFPISGEINFTVRDQAGILDAIERAFEPLADSHSRFDGLSMEFRDWRFNVRPSNTEPLLRLNVETRGDPGLLTDRTAALTSLLTQN